MEHPIRSHLLHAVALAFALAAGAALVSGLAAELSSLASAVVEPDPYADR